MEIMKFIGDLVKFFIKGFIVMFLIVVGLMVLFDDTSDTGTANLVEIKLSGAIMDESAVLKEIYKAHDDTNIKGVLLNIDSPGGALSPSVEISNAIKELNSIKPVVAYASGMMTSGSYLAGINARKIYANEGSFIGSIGVIIQGVNIEELSQKIGFKEQTVSAGEYKQAGTMMREWSEKERESLQELVDKSYDLFTSKVAIARNLSLDKKDEWANARVFLASDALNLGLIDGISSYRDAKFEVIKLSNVSEPIWREKSKYDMFIDSLSTKLGNLILSEMGLKVR
ncbi:MAG: signal peptide peptidase SppA [Campylobacteraceae bacterium]|nr:signal peptide peptidase SppA [Campylobacteraceae bacterium]